MAESPKEWTFTVMSRKSLTPTVFELAFAADPAFRFEAGQYISVIIPGGAQSGANLRRAYSLANAPEEKPLTFCIKAVEGPGTRYLTKLKPGDTFEGVAPYGFFLYNTAPDKDVYFIATGTGIAPFRSMVLSQGFQSSMPRKVTCLYGARGEGEILYENEMKRAVPRLNWVNAITGASSSYSGFRGRVTDYFRTLQPEWANSEFYLCGNGSMIAEIRALLKEKEVPRASIHQEIYFRPPSV